MTPSSLHLFQPPLYRAAGGPWRETVCDAIADSSPDVTIDTGALLGVLSWTFACGDATLLTEVRRQPWLSSIAAGEPMLEQIPQHGWDWMSPAGAARELLSRLKDELAEACRGANEIYVLLSGGLDSRIVAGTLALLAGEGRLQALPSGITWGLEDSRDVQYARATASRLGFGWQHVAIAGADVVENVRVMGGQMAAMSTPLHLHRMPWFAAMPRDAVVLAGSYGDSVGRAEYSGKHLLELSPLKPSNPYGLLTERAICHGRDRLGRELAALSGREPADVPRYVHCEHEQASHYMRCGLGQVMSLINQYCTLYQTFTSPAVYGFMWRLHPSCRADDIYREMLEQMPGGIARLPWARTNRALAGRTEQADARLRNRFQEYRKWCRQDVRDALGERMDPAWFARTGLFDEQAVRRLDEMVAQDYWHNNVYGLWTYLLALRHFVESLEVKGKHVRFLPDSAPGAPGVTLSAPGKGRLLQAVMQRSRTAERLARWLRQRYRERRRRQMRKEMLRLYPPRPADPER